MANISQIKLPNNTTYNIKDNQAVPNTRTVNGKALSSNISLDYTDVGAMKATPIIELTASSVISSSESVMVFSTTTEQRTFLSDHTIKTVQIHFNGALATGFGLDNLTMYRVSGNYVSSEYEIFSAEMGIDNGTGQLIGSLLINAFYGKNSHYLTLSTYTGPSDLILVQSSQPTSSTCKIWVKI